MNTTAILSSLQQLVGSSEEQRKIQDFIQQSYVNFESESSTNLLDNLPPPSLSSPSKEQEDQKIESLAKDVIIVGGGIAGLSAAHELILRGYNVTVYEQASVGGGKASTLRTASGLPTEHGFRVYLSWYENLFDIMSQIPGVIEHLVPSSKLQSVTSSNVNSEFSSGHMFAFLSPQDRDSDTEIEFLRRILSFRSCCNERCIQTYDKISIKQFFHGLPDYFVNFSNVLTAIRPDTCSTHATLQYFTRLRPGEKGYAFDGPTSEVWLNKWKDLLVSRGVRFEMKNKVTSLAADDKNDPQRIVGFSLLKDSKEEVVQKVNGHLVLAVPLKDAVDLLSSAGSQLSLKVGIESMKKLETNWMNGFQIFLDGPIKTTKNGHVALWETPWAVTFINHANVWDSNDIDKSRYQSIVSVIISDFFQKGQLFDKPACECTEDEILQELLHQIINSYPQGHPTRIEFECSNVVAFETGHGLQYGEKKNKSLSPLFINKVNDYQHRPHSKTTIENLHLAGNYVLSNANVACMESACESGRRAAASVLSHQHHHPKHNKKPGFSVLKFPDFEEIPIIAFIKAMDKVLFKKGRDALLSSLSESTQNKICHAVRDSVNKGPTVATTTVDDALMPMSLIVEILMELKGIISDRNGFSQQSPTNPSSSLLLQRYDDNKNNTSNVISSKGENSYEEGDKEHRVCSSSDLYNMFQWTVAEPFLILDFRSDECTRPFMRKSIVVSESVKNIKDLNTFIHSSGLYTGKETLFIIGDNMMMGSWTSNNHHGIKIKIVVEDPTTIIRKYPMLFIPSSSSRRAAGGEAITKATATVIADFSVPGEIIEQFLYVGSAETDGNNTQLLEELGVSVVINMTSENSFHEKNHPHVEYIDLKLEFDEVNKVEEVMRCGMEIIERACHEGKSVIVCSKRGLHRSVSLVVTYLCKSRNMTLEEASEYVLRRRRLSIVPINFQAKMANCIPSYLKSEIDTFQHTHHDNEEEKKGVEFKEEESSCSIPDHVGFILDGNRTWAKSNGLSPDLGHSKGALQAILLIKYLYERGAKKLSLFLLSTENMTRRSKVEIDHISSLAVSAFESHLFWFIESGIRIIHTGVMEGLPDELRRSLTTLMEKTSHCRKFYVNVAINHGGRQQIVEGFKKIMMTEEGQKKSTNIDDISEKDVEDAIYANDPSPRELRDVNLLIRSGDQKRVSNFMLWGISYAEIVFLPENFPSLGLSAFDYVLKEYSRRNRKFGR